MFEDAANEAHGDLEKYQISRTHQAQTVPILKETQLFL